MAQTVGPNMTLEDAIGALASDTTELGIVVGDMFQYAAASLFGYEPEAARYAMETQAWVAQSVGLLRKRVRSVVERYMPDGDNLRRIAELRQATSEYARIAEHAARVAEQALQLQGQAESILTYVRQDAPDLMQGLISVIVDQMRGVFLVTASRDTAVARELIARDAHVEAAYTRIKALLQWRIHNDPFNAVPPQRILIIASDMRQIGAAITVICQAALGYS